MRRYPSPHVGERTLLLRVLAVQCATLQNRYRMLRHGTEALQKHCRALWNVTGALWSHCGMLWGIMEHYGMLRCITEPLQCYGMLREHHGVRERERENLFFHNITT